MLSTSAVLCQLCLELDAIRMLNCILEQYCHELKGQLWYFSTWSFIVKQKDLSLKGHLE